MSQGHKDLMLEEGNGTGRDLRCTKDSHRTSSLASSANFASGGIDPSNTAEGKAHFPIEIL